MFEAPQTKEKSGGAGLYIVIAIVVVLVAGGAWAYMNSKDTANTAAPAAATTAATGTQANPDPVHDLRVAGAAPSCR
jgi:predicted ribosomally synthesized peptide with SipW-like signal peptide